MERLGVAGQPFGASAFPRLALQSKSPVLKLCGLRRAALPRGNSGARLAISVDVERPSSS